MKTLLKKPASLLAMLVMALTMALALSACSETGGDPDEETQGFCINGYDEICYSSTDSECLASTNGYGYYEGINFSTTCPASYNSSPKGCSYNYDGYKDCDLIYEGFTEANCRDYYGGTVKAYDVCLREVGAFTSGSCDSWAYGCENNISQRACNYREGTFKAGGTCPAQVLGSCESYYGGCYDDVNQKMCNNFYEGDWTEGGTCPPPIYGSCETSWGECIEDVQQRECNNAYDGSWNPGTCPAIDLPANAIQLTAENWEYSSIDTEGGEVWYKFNASVGHAVWWVDSDNPDLYFTLDIRVQAYDGNGNKLFNEDVGYPGGHFVNINGIVYLRVTSLAGNQIGTFGILYGIPSGG
jgi:hypothetical protein